MYEQEPKYFTEFRKHIDGKFAETNKNIDSLAVSTAKEFHNIYDKFDRIDEKFEEQKEFMFENFATKDDLYAVETRLGGRIDGIDEKLEKIEGHIGRYEIRAQNIEQILLKDLKPRVDKLELAFGM